VLRTTSPAMLVAWPRRVTHSRHFVRCVRTDATSQTFRCALRRAGHAPSLLGPSHAPATDRERKLCGTYPACDAGRLGRAGARWCPEGSEFCGDEQRRAGVGPRSAHLTSDSPRLFERNERSE